MVWVWCNVKWVLMLKGLMISIFAVLIMSCSTSMTEDVLECDRMVQCTLLTCNGEYFGTVEVAACEAELFER